MCLLDPNTLSEDGTVALKDATFSDDGKLIAYSLSSGGSDWATIKVHHEGGAAALLLVLGCVKARGCSAFYAA